MSTVSSDLNVALSHEREVIHDHWILFLIQGVILTALGLLAIGAPLVVVSLLQLKNLLAIAECELHRCDFAIEFQHPKL